MRTENLLNLLEFARFKAEAVDSFTCYERTCMYFMPSLIDCTTRDENYPLHGTYLAAWFTNPKEAKDFLNDALNLFLKKEEYPYNVCGVFKNQDPRNGKNYMALLKIGALLREKF